LAQKYLSKVTTGLLCPSILAAQLMFSPAVMASAAKVPHLAGRPVAQSQALQQRFPDLHAEELLVHRLLLGVHEDEASRGQLDPALMTPAKGRYKKKTITAVIAGSRFANLTRFSCPVVYRNTAHHSM
jgi:hypothetical protein